MKPRVKQRPVLLSGNNTISLNFKEETILGHKSRMVLLYSDKTTTSASNAEVVDRWREQTSLNTT